MWADKAGKPDVTSQTCRSCTSGYAVDCVEVGADCSDVDAAGAASRKIRQDSRMSSQPAFAMRAADDRDGDGVGGGSADKQEDEAGDGGGDEGERSLRMCWNAPSTLREVRPPRAINHDATKLTTMPSSAVPRTRPLATSGG
jgi:hypothetical protein